MPGTSVENDADIICWNPEVTFHIECMEMSDQTTQYSIYNYSVPSTSLWKCSRIRKMPGTGAENDRGIIRCKPELSCHIERMDISTETTPISISTHFVLSTSLSKCIKIGNMPSTGAEHDPGRIRWKLEISCHIECMDMSSETNPMPISTYSVLCTSLLKCS
jgi:hypothetical protein